MFKLALRNLFRQRTRTGLTLTVIVFGVVGLILSGGFVEDIFVQLREFTIHSQLGHLQVYRKGYYEEGRRHPYKYMIEDASGLVDQLEQLPHTADVMRRVNFSALLTTETADLAVVGEGVEPDKEARLGSYMQMTKGRQLSDADAYGIVIGEGVARSLQLNPGDFITLLLSNASGEMNSLEFEVVGVFQTFSKDFDARAIRIPLDVAQELLNTEAVHSIVLSLDRTESTDVVFAAVKSLLPADRFEIKKWIELSKFYRKTVALYKQQFGILQLIILGMVLLSVANSVSMAANERVGEFGTLRALGQRSRDIRRLLWMENAILGSLGAGIGAALGVILAWGISQIGIPMPPPPNSNTDYTAYIRIIPVAVVAAAAIGLLATMISSVLPAFRVSRVDIADALRQNI